MLSYRGEAVLFGVSDHIRGVEKELESQAKSRHRLGEQNSPAGGCSLAPFLTRAVLAALQMLGKKKPRFLWEEDLNSFGYK